MATIPTFTATPRSSGVQILPADASALKTVFTPGASGSKVTALIATSSDTVSRDVTLGVTRSAIFYPLCTVTIPITAGQVAATAAVNFLSSTNAPGLPVDNDGQVYLFLASTDILQVKSLTTVTAAKELDFNCFGADF